MQGANDNNGIDTGQKGTGRVLRIKVVNLLYLIFFVLAFLYIPADFVDIFKIINNNYEESVQDYYSQEYSNLYDYNLIIFDYLVKNHEDSARFKQNLSKVSQSATQIINRLEKYKHHLITISGGYNEYGYLENGKNYNYSEEFFITRGFADTVRKMLQGHKNLIRAVSGHLTYLKVDSLLTDKDELVSSNGRMVKWKKYYFDKMPVAGSVALLSKFQHDLKQSENYVVESYIDDMKAEGDTINIGVFAKIMADTILPKLQKELELKVRDKKIYRTGEKVDLAIRINDEDLKSIKGYVKKEEQTESVEFENKDGVLKASYFPYEEGEYSFIVYIGDDKLEKTIRVREIKPVISSPQGRVFYSGIDNELIVRHSNFEPGQIILKASRGEVKRKDSVFVLNFRSGGKVVLEVYGRADEGSVLLSKETIAVKELPVSQPVISGKYEGQISGKELKSQNRMVLVNEFTGTNEVYSVKEFKVIRLPVNSGLSDKQTVVNAGATFSASTNELMNEASKGDVYIFDYIKVEDKHGREADAPSIVLTVI